MMTEKEKAEAVAATGPKPKDVEHTKTRAYAWLDLISKILSSFALVTLGIAGWLLQSRTEKTRESRELLDRQERIYLPMLRSLSELDLALDDTIFLLHYLRSPEDEQRLYDAGVRMRYYSQSLFVPEGDPAVSIRQAGGTMRRRTHAKVPLRAAGLMLGEVMGNLWFLRDRERGARLQLDPTTHSLVVVGEQRGSKLYLTRETLPAWTGWLGNDTISPQDLYVSIRPLAYDLQLATAQVAHEVVLRHLDLGDKYVEIRNDVFNNHQSYINRAATSITTEANRKAKEK